MTYSNIPQVVDTQSLIYPLKVHCLDYSTGHAKPPSVAVCGEHLFRRERRVRRECSPRLLTRRFAANIRGISSRVFNKIILMKSHRKQYLIEHERYKCERLSRKGTNKSKYLRNRRYFSAGKIQHEKILIQTNLV